MKFKLLITILLTANFCFSQSLPEEKNSRHRDMKFFAILGGGASFRTAKSQDGISGEEKAYLKELKSGRNFDLSIYYQKSEVGGFGLKYNLYQSKADGESVANGKFGDDIKISFIGATAFISENTSARVGEAFLELGLGYIEYKNSSYVFNDQRMSFKGGNLGLATSLAYHFRINKHILIGPQFAFVGGILKKIKITYPDNTSETVTLDDDALESLYRIDLNVSAKIRF